MVDSLQIIPLHIVPSSSFKKLGELSPRSIWIRFRSHGALLFRGFSPTIDEFKSFTAQFCPYFIAYPGGKREAVNNETDIQTVDVTRAGIPLHSELSYSPVRPDIGWFFCVTPPRRGGQTILCDGIALAEALPTALKRFLANKTLRFTAVMNCGTWQKMLGCDTSAQAIRVIRQRSYVDMSVTGNEIRIDHLTVPLARTKLDNRVAFCNNLILHHAMRTDVHFTDGSILSDALYKDLVQVSAKFTVEIAWNSGDLLMIDNTRMMHGRRPVLDDDRLILTRFGGLSGELDRRLAGEPKRESRIP